MTWTFDAPREVGYYANGDPWVVGPVGIVEISPPSTTESGRTTNGAMINPSPRDGHELGYGQMSDVVYEPGKNAAAGITGSTPLLLDPGSSLVSTISVDEADGRPGIHAAAVLTVVEEAPRAGSFRPPYSGDDKRDRFTTDDLRRELLPRLDPVEGSPDLGELAVRFERVWLDHTPGWTGRSIHPRTSMPDYGRDLASLLGQGALALMLDVPEAEKERLLINYVQVGIDLFGVVEDGGERNWEPNGGHAHGRKWPILFAGVMLDDSEMAGIGRRDDVLFGEDAQTFYVGEDDVRYVDGYTRSDLGTPEWGIRHATDPTMDDANWDAQYRRCCTANSWAGHVLAARLMGLQEAWNHDALFDYTDRYVATEDPGTWERFWDRPFTEAMWEAYRPQY